MVLGVLSLDLLDPLSLSCQPCIPPSIPHFAIEESVIKPRTLAKFRVYGLPTLLFLNSTMRVRYHGSQTLGSPVAFYNDVTGLMTAPLDGKSLERIQHSSDREEKSGELESYPISWARSPKNLLRQETYLPLATAFVLSRLLYFIFSTVCMYSMGLERGHPKHKVKELVGTSSVIFESSNSVVQFLEGTVQEK